MGRTSCEDPAFRRTTRRSRGWSGHHAPLPAETHGLHARKLAETHGLHAQSSFILDLSGLPEPNGLSKATLSVRSLSTGPLYFIRAGADGPRYLRTLRGLKHPSCCYSHSTRCPRRTPPGPEATNEASTSCNTARTYPGPAARPPRPSMCCQTGPPALNAHHVRRPSMLTSWHFATSMCCKPGQPALSAQNARGP